MAVTIIGIAPNITDSTPTNAVAPATPDTAKVANPVANANTPTPTNVHAAPNKTNTPDNPAISGSIGESNTAAPANNPIDNANPAKLSNSVVNGIVDNSINDGANIAIAPAAIISAAAPGNAVCINAIATAKAVSEPLKAIKAIAVPSGLMVPSSATAVDNITTAPEATVKAAAPANKPTGLIIDNAVNAVVMIANPPNIPSKP